MIAGWVVYCLISSTMIAVLTAAIDEWLTRRQRPARWIWFGAIVASLAIPAVILLMQQRALAPVPNAAEVRFGDVVARVQDRERMAEWRANRSFFERLPRLHTPQWTAADGLVTAAIIASILLATLRVAVDSLSLFRQRRRWRAGEIDGVAVLLSGGQGPAIVGLIDPSIVVPDWAAALSGDERALMLAHETEHLRARDGVFSSAALLGALCMPWNPVTWYAFRRLRTAVEVDCDRRVLRAFPDVSRYGQLLVDVAERANDSSSLAITGFSEGAQPLARRIRAMTTRRTGATPLPLLFAPAACLGAVAALFVVLPPPPFARQLPPTSRPPLLLQKNVGDSIASFHEVEGGTIRVDTRMVGRARDLPVQFVVDDPGIGDGTPLSGRCATRLRDSRNNTQLQLRYSSAGTGSIAQRGDTAWTRVSATGLYHVEPAGSYGLSGDQLLRVGCGATTKMTIAGQTPSSKAISTLETSTDARARRVASALDSALGRKADEVELYAGRMNVVVSDTAWMSRTREARWAETKAVWSVARAVLGAAAMPETLAYSVRARDVGTTLYYYSSHPR